MVAARYEGAATLEVMDSRPVVPPDPRANRVGWACAAVVLCIWTSFILVARSSASGTLSPFDLAFLRFLVSGLVLVALARWRAPRTHTALPTARWAALGVIAGVAYCGLAYSAFFFAPAAHGAVLLPGSLPLWTALGAWWLLRERPTRQRVAGLALIAGGDLLVGGASLLHALDGGTVWIGDLLLLGASALWGLYTVLCRRWRVSAFEATLAIGSFCLVSAVPLYALAAAAGWVDSRLGAAPWSEILFQGVFQGLLSMVVAGIAFTQVVVTFGAVRSTMITALVPPIAALAAVPLLGEALAPTTWFGLAAVTGGLLLGLRGATARTSVPRPVLEAR